MGAAGGQAAYMSVGLGGACPVDRCRGADTVTGKAWSRRLPPGVGAVMAWISSLPSRWWPRGWARPGSGWRGCCIGELPAVRVPAQAEEAAGFGYSLLDLDLDRADPFPVGSVATS